MSKPMTLEEALHSIEEDGIRLNAGDFVDVEALKVAANVLRKVIAGRLVEPGREWISVEERMPQQFVSVLACIPCEHPLPMVKEAYFANGCWATRMAIFSDKDVSHWMPIPEPPGEDAK